MINSKFTPLVYTFLTHIPRGKVVTYGQIAKKIKCPSPRLIGNILHTNTDPIKYPCYKVVNTQGKVSASYAYGGKKAQIKKLQNDGIEVRNGKVDLKIYFWNP
jgi:O-6-methylguanine DNA methyltransferase